MSEQITWIPTPKKRKTVKLVDALSRASVLADYYSLNKPEIKRIVVTGPDYAAFEAKVNTNGISLRNDGVYWRGFLIEPAS